MTTILLSCLAMLGAGDALGRDSAAETLRRLGAKLRDGVSEDDLQSYRRVFRFGDLNGDGVHSREEYVEKGRYLTPKARAGIFRAADSDGDDYVTRDEYVLNRIITDEAKAIVSRTDADRNGIVTRDEFVSGSNVDAEFAAQVFDGIDTNGDGATAPPEYLRVWGRWARSALRFRMNRRVSREEVIRRTLAPYAGPFPAATESTRVDRIDATTLTGKVVCGYQGWFSCDGDGSGRGWNHWQKRGQFRPGMCTIDLWPDVSELDPEERFATPFRNPDGSVAEVYSPLLRKTVVRHFKWMADHSIDGVFVQRFGVSVRGAMGLYHCNTVLANCRAGANRHGRGWAVMYDLSGLRRDGTRGVIDDWKMLVDHMKVGRDPADKAYMRHAGKPLVAVWGIGFDDGRQYTLEECERLVEFLVDDPVYGGNTVMVGVPTYWRTLRRDCVNDPRVHAIIRKAHIVSPWMVGRFRTLKECAAIAQRVWEPDIAWCRNAKLEYLPVVFPGFSWHNMKPDSPLGKIPRQSGRFLWKQFVEAKRAGATMIYQAMFDEVDEATAIFKCTNSPPVGESPFLDYEGLPSDHYLWLVGQGGRLLRGEIEPTETLPTRRPARP